MDTYGFSPREKEVLDHLLQGKSNKQIAFTLGISTNTIEFHLKNIYKKLDVNSRAEAIVSLGKSVPAGADGWQPESSVEEASMSFDNGIVSNFLRSPIMKKLILPLIGLILIALGIIKITNAANSTVPPAPTSHVIAQVSQPVFSNNEPEPTISPKVGTPIVEQVLKSTAPIDGKQVSVRLTWFYADSKRVSGSIVIENYPVPEGMVVTRYISNVEVTKPDGTLLQQALEKTGGGGTGGKAPLPANIVTEDFGFPLINNAGVDPKAVYDIAVMVGGTQMAEAATWNAAEKLSPEGTFTFKAASMTQTSCSFEFDKVFTFADKAINFTGANIDPAKTTLFYCVHSADGQQWYPAMSILYHGASYPVNSFILKTFDSAKPGDFCYEAPVQLPFDLADDPKQAIQILVQSFYRDYPEVIPPEEAAAAVEQLKSQGIAFRYEAQDHGANFYLDAKPADMSEESAWKLIWETLRHNANAEELILLDLR